MGCQVAPDEMDQAHRTHARLAAGDDPDTQVTGDYFYHLKLRALHPKAHDPALQDRRLAI
jgi:hypothetical protein